MDYKAQIAANIANITDIPAEEVFKLTEIPPQLDMGDYAFPCFILAKTMHKAPQAIAADLAGNEAVLKGMENAVEAVAAGPYLNFKIKKDVLAKEIISEILSSGDEYGKSNMGEGKNVIVEFSSPNIAKPFHVGHAFTTLLGNSLSKIYSRLGYNVIRMNHLGDYGTQFGKLITAYRLWGDEEALNRDPINELLRIYVKFHDEAVAKPELEDDARENFRKLEEGSAEEVALWQRFRDLSLDVFNQLYDRMGIGFDNYNGESYYAKMADEVVDMLKEKNLLVESEGAQVVPLDEYNMPPCIILKSDGTTIYATRDIAAILYRYRNYQFDKNVYVVGIPQALHFRQVFSVLKKAGFDWADNCVHVGFGLVKFKDNTAFSTRKGNIVKLDDLLNETVAKTREVIVENNKTRGGEMTEDEIDLIAEKVGLGAVTYTYLKAGRERDILFDWDEMLDFEGDTAPYLIYTYARSRSILRKAEEQGYKPAGPDAVSVLTSDEEYALIRSMGDLPDAVRRAATEYEPFIIAKQVSLIARNFNRFYNNSKIINSDDDALRAARLTLCECLCDAMKSGLGLLGIDVVERM